MLEAVLTAVNRNLGHRNLGHPDWDIQIGDSEIRQRNGAKTPGPVSEWFVVGGNHAPLDAMRGGSSWKASYTILRTR